MDGLPPKEIAEFRKIADLFTKKKYNLDILKKENEYPLLSQAIEDHFKNSERRKTLLLPELTYENKTISIFSDYGGESNNSNYLTYSFLISAWDHLGRFHQAMAEIREKHDLKDKEISFKDFRYWPIKRGLDDYLSALNIVPGMLFNVIVEKEVTSFFSKDKKQTDEILLKLKNNDLGEWKPAIVEKLLRVCHISAYLVSLLSQKDQKIFWMTDDDSIAANQKAISYWLSIFNNLLNYYSHHSYSLVGGAVPFKDRDLKTLDLLSCPDISAGSIEHYYTRMSKSIDDIKEEADKVLRWMCHDGLMLKKHSIIVKKGEGKNLISGSLKFNLKVPDITKVLIPLIRP